MAEATAKSPEREDANAASDPAQQIAESFRPLTRPPLRLSSGVLAAAAVVLVTLAFLGYRMYEMLSYTDIPVSNVRLSPPVSGEVQLRPTKDASEAGRSTAAVESPVVKPDRGAASPRPVDATAESAPTQSSTAEPTATRRASSQDTAAAAAQSAATQPITAPAAPRRATQQAAAARKAVVQEPPRSEPCTDAMAVLGLCTAVPGQAAAAPTAPPRVSAASKAVERAQPGAATCTAGVAALGLCAPASSEKRE